MKDSCILPEVNSGEEGSLIDLGSLHVALAALCDRRNRRGLRYALVTVMLFIVLAKICGEDHLRGIAQWVRLRKEVLAVALGLEHPQAPHACTYSRILNQAVDIEEFEQVVSEFLSAQATAGKGVVLSLDGKTLRGTIAAGATHGTHLLAAYLPEQELVLLQVEVDSHENEIPAAMRIIKRIDLRGKIVTGDALLAQRELSAQIVDRGGEYLWKIKGNQSQTLEDIQELFRPERCTGGFSPCHKDFRSCTTYDKEHGRLETRTLTASSMLKEYLDWPYAEQVFRIERRTIRLSDGKVTEETAYGITSLTSSEADPRRLLYIARSHWGIENGLHYRRDETLKEDRCRLKGQAGRAMATMNNLALALLLNRGFRHAPDARRYYAANLWSALSLILQPLA